MQEGIIFDFDDCFVDSREIIRNLPEENTREAWDEYHSKLVECNPNKEIVEYARFLQQCTNKRVIFVTSREDIGNVRDITEKNIMANGIFSHLLLMRPADCYDSSPVVKRMLYEKYLKGIFDIKLAIDDDEANCKMWQELGINTFTFSYGKEA